MNTDAAAFDELVEQVRGVFFGLRGASAALLEEFGASGPERSVLADLERLGPQTVPAMAQARAISRQAMQKTVDRLIGRGWLRTAPNPRHLRSVLVELTPAGKKTFAAMRQRELAGLARAELTVSAAELRRASRTLAAVRAALADLSPGGPR